MNTIVGYDKVAVMDNGKLVVRVILKIAISTY